MLIYLIISKLLAAVPLACDPTLAALFTPAAPTLGVYQVCTTEQPLDELVAEASGQSNRTDQIHYGTVGLLQPLDAFGTAGAYDRAALARLYGGRRVRVVRGWARDRDRFESRTLLSPYPDSTLSALHEGTMTITWTVRRP